MTFTTNNLQHGNQDRYPSRGNLKAKLVERLDPVVHTEDPSCAPIDANLIEDYKNQGFLVLDEVFTEAEVCKFQHELKRLRSDVAIKYSDETITELGGGDVRSIFKIHEVSPVFKQLAVDARLAGLARYLLDDQVYIHQ